MESEKILLVDDEPNVLAAYERQIRKQFTIDTMPGAEEGLEAVKSRGPYAVIVSDFRMPNMDGIQFLTHVKALSPETVRMMLTGYADINTTIEAVNEGNVFRFLTKPCSPESLTKALMAGIEQYRLVIAERELLEKTLKNSIKVLMELLGFVNPEAFGRCSRIQSLVKEIARSLDVPDLWQFETAAMLSQIGGIIFPEEVISKLYRGEELNSEETQMFDMHPLVGSDLIAKIPRMEEIARMIAYQEKHFDGGGTPRDSLSGIDIPLGARILKIALDFDILEAKGLPRPKILEKLKKRAGLYDPDMLAAINDVLGIAAKENTKLGTVKDLLVDMIIAENLYSEDGILLVAKGQRVNDAILYRLRSYARGAPVKEPFQIMMPQSSVGNS
jgi:response regulator RpfG family c-di-GMP phosphodiesterase